MPVPEALKKDYDALPDAPGVYIYKDLNDHEIYVGKAISLRKRVRQYFDTHRATDAKTVRLMTHVRHIEFIECQSEVEAYLLENRLIKDLQPRFNTHAKSDISFPSVEITDEVFPRVRITRDLSHKTSKYYGPFINGRQLRAALDALQRVFKFRACNQQIVENDPKNRLRRPCLKYYLDRCHGPCAGLISSNEYKANIRRLSLFLRGYSGEVINELKYEMKRAAKERRFEEAVPLRDTLQALNSLREHGSLRDGIEPAMLHIDPQIGVKQLQKLFKLQQPPRYIEGIDIAHLQGDETVGALVSFTDGLPRRDQYRRFRIKTVAGADDFACISEVVTRRYSRLLRESSSLPDLVLIDGGLGQLTAAHDALNAVIRNTTTTVSQASRLPLAHESPHLLEQAGETPAVREKDHCSSKYTDDRETNSKPPADKLPLLVALAKKEEIIYTMDQSDGIRLSRRSPGLRLLQHIRDEAHRFAQRYHHILRRKRVMEED
ncbi:MAG: GIY-YIG nuclease family protein [Planctomycetota bacterium]